MLLNRDELYEKLETAILNLPKRTFLNYREPLKAQFENLGELVKNTIFVA